MFIYIVNDKDFEDSLKASEAENEHHQAGGS